MSGVLTFDKSRVAALLDASPDGLYLVGDEGVYLASTKPVPEGEFPVVCYAEECDPGSVPFDEWWDIKGRTFGGNDGADLIPGDALRRAVNTTDGATIAIELSGTTIGVVSYEETPCSGTLTSQA